MRKSRAFRRIVVLFLYAVIIATQTAIFAETWFRYYNESLEQTYYKWGFVVLFGLYAVMFALFSNVYGAFKLGSLQFANLFFSQVLAIILSNALIFVQISLIAFTPHNDLFSIVPMIGMRSKCNKRNLYKNKSICQNNSQYLREEYVSKLEASKFESSVHIAKECKHNCIQSKKNNETPFIVSLL